MSGRKIILLALLAVALVAATWRASGQGAGRVFLPVAVDNRPALALVSRHSNGTLGNGHSADGQLSADGQYVYFTSEADNLVDGDTNGQMDNFIHNRQTRQTILFEFPPLPDLTDVHDSRAYFSPYGRYVAFGASLRVGDLNTHYDDLFVLDRQTGQTTLVSRHTNGTPGDLLSHSPAFSADGRFVVFGSSSTNLIDNDVNEFLNDIYVHDRQTGQTMLVSRHTNGTQGNRQSEFPSISADGRFVAFSSIANNLADADTNDANDVFVHDRQTGHTTLISRGLGGASGNGDSWSEGISANGRYVLFLSGASDLVADDTQLCFQIRTCEDVFVHDRQTGQTTLVSRHSNGTPGNHASFDAAISADGRIVAFSSYATNLVDHGVNSDMDVFVHNRQTGRTSLVSNHPQASPIIRLISQPYLSADGRFVAFTTDATNLVSDDVNGKRDVFVYDHGPVSGQR